MNTGSVYDWEYPESSYNANEDDLDDKILKYAATEDGVPAGMYRDIDQDEEIPTHPFDGLWTGTYSYGEETMIRDGVVSAHLYIYDEAQNVFAGSGRDGIGSFEISGNITPAGSPCEQQIWFKKEYRQVMIMDQANIWAYRGAISVEDSGRMTAMTGEWGPWVDDPLEFRTYGTFKMDRTPAIVARHRPSVAEFENNAARARWKLALNVVEEQIRQKLLSWNHYRQRRDDRKKFVDAYVVCTFVPVCFFSCSPDDTIDSTLYLELIRGDIAVLGRRGTALDMMLSRTILRRSTNIHLVSVPKTYNSTDGLRMIDSSENAFIRKCDFLLIECSRLMSL
jgi:hypothetical protein